ncbi:uncharacterized protein LOC124271199 [Haliotis rubra]|uniref:uncharacterized protein LOC124271199 n=1 Tax=Haliotis rubra TaxID=36100 RepID=UPI001EE50DAA|nr:uncharacterized protein LOC124271199 [Haliotis rubra]XP_046562237.1 uncharacterized protein LOC124271199 [Haliotis rubra]XP_046562238.1 uncharacterized protein LOC124271199 [Haliotis rubra]
MRRLYNRAFLAVAGIICLLVFLQVNILSKHEHSREEGRHHQVISYRDVSDQIVPTTSIIESNVVNVTEHGGTELLNSGQKTFILNYEKALDSGTIPPVWQRELYKNILTGQRKTRFYLSHLLMVRLYSADKAKWTIRELKQWLHYMFLAGVEHVYICDHWHTGDDDMERQLRRYITLHLVSYKRIYTHNAMQAQVQCYKKWVEAEGSNSTWMTSVDMDEYPYHVEDKQEKFLQRYLKDVQHRYPDVAEVSMPNFLMLGQGDRSRNITVDRIRRSTPDPANKLVKPIFQPCCVRPDIHKGSVMSQMRRMPADPKELRMLHYWGSRLQNWGPDNDELLKITIPYNDMADTWVGRIRNSLLSFGEKDAFSHKSGP